MKRSSVVTFTVPDELKSLLEAVQVTGYYDSLSEFLRDAIRQCLSMKKDLRIAVAYELWKQKRISLGKAAEIIQSPVDEVKELFKDREVKV